MANALYPLFKQALLSKTHNLATDTVRALLVDSADYTYSAAHAFLSDITAIGVVASVALTAPTVALGVFDTADFTWPAVTGDQAEAIVLVNYTGNSAASDAARQLIAFFDTGMTGMPVTPNGGAINCTVNAAGFFSL